MTPTYSPTQRVLAHMVLLHWYLHQLVSASRKTDPRQTNAAKANHYNMSWAKNEKGKPTRLENADCFSGLVPKGLELGAFAGGHSVL